MFDFGFGETEEDVKVESAKQEPESDIVSLKDFKEWLIKKFKITDSWINFPAGYYKKQGVKVASIANHNGNHTWVENINDWYSLFHGVSHHILRHNYIETKISETQAELEALLCTQILMCEFSIPFDDKAHFKKMGELMGDTSKDHIAFLTTVCEKKAEELIQSYITEHYVIGVG